MRYLLPAGWLVLIIVLVFVISHSFLFKNRTPNIIVLSACSLKKDVITAYQSYLPGSDLENAYINKLAKKSFVFKQAVSYDAYRGIAGYLRNIPKSLIEKREYLALGAPNRFQSEVDLKNKLNNIPQTASIGDYLFRYDDPRKYFQNIQSRIEQAIKDKKPFILVSHTEWLHFPFGEMDDVELRSFLAEQKINSPEKEKRLSFLLALFPYPLLNQYFPQYFPQKSAEDALVYAWNVIKDPKNLSEWKNSFQFKKDQKILDYYYKKQFLRFSSFNQNILEKRENDSFIFVVGCHGEPFYDHNEFLHGNGLDEESVSIPLLIHAPGMTEQIDVNHQVGMKPIAELIIDLAINRVSNEDFKDKVERQLVEDNVLHFNCAGNKFALRTKEKIKFVVDLSNDEKEIFDLNVDPLAVHNIFSTFPPDKKIALERQFYELLNDNLPLVKRDLKHNRDCLYRVRLQENIFK